MRRPTTASTSPILQLEINEIPWRILNHYRDRYPHIREFFASAKELTTATVDEGELSPWVTWPTIHRGLPNTQHRSLNLGQDPTTFRGTPIWDEYLARGYSVGLFGSMQSWPARDPGPGGFWVPDTFAHDERTIPSHIEPLQRFNLDQVAHNGRVVVGSRLKPALQPRFFMSLLRSGVKGKTLLRVARQLADERRDSNLRARRPIFQTVLFWDVFKHLYRPRDPPAFSTFFTNHVAGVMHRYWHHLFPGDYPPDAQPKERIHHETIDFAMSVLDDILSNALDWMRSNPNLSVVFATSMGQGPVHRLAHHGHEAVVRDTAKLLLAVGIGREQFQPLLAMAPQIAVETRDAATRARAKELLEAIQAASGERLFKVQAIGNSLSITLVTPSLDDCVAQRALLPDGSMRPFEELGIHVWETDAGSAYHIPEGILAINGPLQDRFPDSDEPIPADQVKGLLMQAAGLATTHVPAAPPAAR
jgi:hypothetical protein